MDSATIKDNLSIININYVKSQNRSIISSMNNMKQIISQSDKYNPTDNEAYEQLINQTPFKYLSYRSPAEVHSSNLSSYLVD